MYNKKIYFVSIFLSLFFIFFFNGRDTFPDYNFRNKEKELLTAVDFESLYYRKEILWAFPDFQLPLEGTFRISSEFGNREVIVKGIGGEQGDFHRGIDIVPKSNRAKVMTVGSGIVELHYPPPNRKYRGHPVFGGMVVIKHGNGVYTLYGHLKETYVHTGQYLKKGEIIGVVGNTGISTGTHLHFEILLDPMFILEQE